MNKLHFMVAAFLALFLAEISLSAEEESLTLVIGNCRRPGGLKDSTAKLVGQDKADFTHTKSFKGRVVSVDICPLRPPYLGKHTHLTIDFAHESPDTILSGLKNISPTRVFFEWFPSCITQNPGKNITPLLLPALRNAFAILPPGGELIIDHSPYTLNLPDSFPEALKALQGEKVNVNTTHLREAITSPDRFKEPGITSHFLQNADPFTLHMCHQEQEEIRKCLMFRVKNDDAPYNDAQCQFIKGKDHVISQLASQFSSALNMDKIELMIRISNGMLYSSQGVKEEEHGYWDLFEQHYYMATRGSLIFQALRNIGFIVEEDAIQYHEVNPYNKRKHAWLISAKKT